jgi:membrane-associated phospholipid phosphatase
MPVIALLVVALATGTLAWLLARSLLGRWWGRAPSTAVAEEVRELTPVRRFVRNRFDAEALAGLALTLAFAALVLCGVIVSVLALLVRRNELVSGIDSSAADWAHRNTGDATRRALEAVTWMASTTGAICITTAAAAAEWVRVRSRWIPLFLVVATIGDSLATNLVKGIVDRARPTLDPAAATLGPSFPSGHASMAAAMLASIALLAGRRRSARARALLAGLAVGLAVAVACSRMLLDLHWVSDVVAGLAFGWGWFAICAAAFGGWLLRLGAPVEQAAGVERTARAGQAGRDVVRS